MKHFHLVDSAISQGLHIQVTSEQKFCDAMSIINQWTSSTPISNRSGFATKNKCRVFLHCSAEYPFFTRQCKFKDNKMKYIAITTFLNTNFYDTGYFFNEIRRRKEFAILCQQNSNTSMYYFEATFSRVSFRKCIAKF